MTFRHVKTFGFEVEGAWDHEPDCGCLKRDGSVTAEGEFAGGSEIASPVFPTHGGGFRRAKEFMWGCYPHRVNASCGFHIHFGVPDANVMAVIMDSRSYHDYILAAIRSFATRKRLLTEVFKSRLDGRIGYCNPVWDAHERILIDKSDVPDRYRAVNIAAWTRHGTVEIRVLPMFAQKKNAWRMLKRVLSATEWWLRKQEREAVERSEVFHFDCPAELVPEVIEARVEQDEPEVFETVLDADSQPYALLGGL